MTPNCMIRLIAGSVLTVCAPLLTGATSLTGNLQHRVLAAHNRERTALGIKPLVWDEKLRASAQSWADHLAATSAFEHAPDNVNESEGENLWAGTRGSYSAEAMVDGWIRERRFFKPGSFPDNSTTGRVADVGHYTQLVWRDTGSVGCAVASGRSEDVLVCRYSDAGNYVGERPY